MYSRSSDPWQLGTRWYEQRKYALTLAMLPRAHYEHAFEPGCSVGVLTNLLAERCTQVTATDIASTALDGARRRLANSGHGERVTLLRRSIDEPWPTGPFDLLVLSEVGYYLAPEALGELLERECPRLAAGATVVAAHWRHRVDDYLMGGDEVNEIVAGVAGMQRIGSYRDADVAIDVFDNAEGTSVAASSGVPMS
ncbi:SAM-dependent methyltransferase [Mycobacterium paraterrae]|uniref:Nodulation S family protein n=1 Tax=Mycobacterium paraterrae TaxID=577492 RepID=A0ABY3VQB9_9MYCO|nr:SAM-dependent methyltransferase [Mycobacterium paraterrae]UMB71642.1 nodulation S family protein [Mycobacterium paraterrae]